MNLMNLFINPVGRIRSGWRFLIFVITFSVVSIALTEWLKLVLSNLPVDEATKNILFFIFVNLLAFICAVVVGWLCGKLLEQLPFRALGCWFTKNWFKDLALGLVIGTLSILFAAVISMTFGDLSFQLNQTVNSTEILKTLGISWLVFVIGAASEETVYRGYVVQTFSRAKLIWFGILLTSLPFALGHAGNPNVSTFGLINTALAGIWFGVAYLKTRNLWFPFGLHFMWNWVQGAFLGIPVSGIRAITPNPILQPIDVGPTWLTGGHYGLEGGFACTVALIISTLFIWFLPILKPTDEMLALTNEENPKADFLT